MKPFRLIVTLALLVVPVVASAKIQPEVGVSYFALRDTELERGSYPLWTDEPSETSPFVAATYEFNERFGLRLSYHYLDDVRTTTQLGSPPGSPLAVVVWGHFNDDVHLFSAAPEFRWSLAPKLTFAIAPQLNWVASKGVVSYSTNDPLVLLVAPRKWDDDGVTLGGSARFLWSLGRRAALTLGYQYLDLDPSFGREAHVVSGGVQWSF